MKNPWTTLAKQLKYDNPWIRVEEHEVLNPNGNPGIYGAVYFKNQAVGVFPYEDGHVWMVGQYRYVLDQYSWEIPEGGSPQGEDPLQTAQRELLEETGLVASNYEKLLELHLSNSVSDEWGIVYLATGFTQHQANPEDTEDLRVKRMPLEELFAEVEAGKITDSLTVAAVYKVMMLKAQGKLA
ncbi:MAG: NUDIX hydrolase [Bacteroidia bacterium]|nr:NUDIX hydrolase [Bacteroidia bacterium]